MEARISPPGADQSSPLEKGDNLSSENKEKERFPKVFVFFLLAVVGLLVGGIFGYCFYQGVKKELLPAFGEKPTPVLTLKPTVPVSGENQLSAAHNKFGFQLLKQVCLEGGEENVVISPTSVALALSMTYNGAVGETKEAMARALQLGEVGLDEVNEQGAALMDLIKNPDPKVEIAVANSIWGREGEKFNPQFLEANQSFYQAKVGYLDFSDPETVAIINQWVSENTRGKIPSIIQPPIAANVVMYLVNAIYFKGTWTFEFDEALTEEKEFTLADGAVKKHPMMTQKIKNFNYFEDDLFQVVSLPYGENKRLRMVIVLPKGDLAGLVESLTREKWQQWLVGLKETKGTLVLPRFKVEYKKRLNESLSVLGMGIAFTGKADFSQIGPNLFISQVLHKTFIEVNEQGTEAAVATAVEIGITAVMPEWTFYMEVNKPFFFAIQDSQSEEVLFIGLIQEPL